MTRPTFDSRVPGRYLIELARLMFDEPARSTIVDPAIADLQHEVREAGDDGRRRFIARARGCAAFWKIVAVCLVVTPVREIRRSSMTTLTPARTGGQLLVVLSLVLFAAIWPVFGWFSVAALAFGLVLAIGLRAWHTRHPGARAATLDPLLALTGGAMLAALWSMFGWFVVATLAGSVVMAIALSRWNARHPSTMVRSDALTVVPDARINMSSIPVAGDMGGLFFVIGAVVIVLLGLPDVRWFVLGSVVAGAATAGVLFAWRAATRGNLPAVTSIRLP